ncbi:isochorismatase family protein [Actinomadura rudentiformis]|uniref:Isochorismatase family protein n=1 Tax=Actinomadura rudentiformis TaxID=359158 RepID=A0A6H9YMC5_9ACTN|nr:isochorismatase family protein [Actinomadura rudentiformis]KAB2346960.1 isochorismatase family protein [Actinomadura rudentiformis]
MPIPEIPSYPMPRAHDVPENTAPWAVRPERAVLLIHDMQRYFVRFFPQGVPPVTDLVRNVRQLLQACREMNVPVAYTAQPGSMSDEQRGLLKDIWGAGMSADPDHRAIIDELAPAPGERIFTKWRYSAFHNSDLLDYLVRAGRDQLVVCGIYAHVGCLITACDAFSHDIETFLVADAIADFTEEYHRLALWYAAERCAGTPLTSGVLASINDRHPAGVEGAIS